MGQLKNLIHFFLLFLFLIIKQTSLNITDVCHVSNNNLHLILYEDNLEVEPNHILSDHDFPRSDSED